MNRGGSPQAMDVVNSLNRTENCVSFVRAGGFVCRCGTLTYRQKPQAKRQPYEELLRRSKHVRSASADAETTETSRAMVSRTIRASVGRDYLLLRMYLALAALSV